jgi:hypothetical protein
MPEKGRCAVVGTTGIIFYSILAFCKKTLEIPPCPNIYPPFSTSGWEKRGANAHIRSRKNWVARS